jgi:transcriptional regulator with XRE-family HTH domain
MPEPRGRGDPKELMRADIERIRAALRSDKRDKHLTVRELARALDCSRGEASNLTRADDPYWYKRNGLSKKTISRLLKAEAIPESTKALIREYLCNRDAGLYGHEPCERTDPSAA